MASRRAAGNNIRRRRRQSDSDSSDSEEAYVTVRRRESVIAERTGIGRPGLRVGASDPLASSRVMASGRPMSSSGVGGASKSRDSLAASVSAPAFAHRARRSGAAPEGSDADAASGASGEAGGGGMTYSQSLGVFVSPSFTARRRSTVHEMLDDPDGPFGQGGSGPTSVAGDDNHHGDGDGDDGFPTCLMCLPPHKAPALDHSSLWLLGGGNRPRVFVHNLVKHRYFEAAIIAVIAANSIVLVFDDPTSPNEAAWVQVLDIVFAVIFTIEMLLKVVAFGFALHAHAYLRDPWNRLDFLIVLLAWLAFVPGFGNYSGLRVLRVLRPLRSMNAVKGLKVLVTALLQSFRGLIPVLILAGIVMSVFAIVGVQLWEGKYRYRCVADVPFRNLTSMEIETQTVDHFAGYRCDPDASDFHGNLGTSCPAGYTCAVGSNPKFGFVNFDNTGVALLVVFQVITFEGWPFVLRTAMEVGGTASFIYFLALVLLGSYFIPNLALAVINDKYHGALEKHYRREMQEAEEELERRRRESLDRAGAALVPLGRSTGEVVKSMRPKTPPRSRGGRRTGPTDQELRALEAHAAEQNQTTEEAEDARRKMERLSKRRGSRRMSAIQFAASGHLDASQHQSPVHGDFGSSSPPLGSSLQHHGSPRRASMSVSGSPRGGPSPPALPRARRRGSNASALSDGSPHSPGGLTADNIASSMRRASLSGGDGSQLLPFTPANAAAPSAAGGRRPSNVDSLRGSDDGRDAQADATEASPIVAGAAGHLSASNARGAPQDADSDDGAAPFASSFKAWGEPDIQDAESTGASPNQHEIIQVTSGGAADFGAERGNALGEECEGADDSPHDDLSISTWLRLRNTLHNVVIGVDLPEYSEREDEIERIERERAMEGSPFGVALFIPGGRNKTEAERQEDADSSSTANTTPFTVIIITCIVLNTVVLAAQHHNQPEWLDQLTEVANIVFLAIFAAELVVVMIAVGFSRFFRSGFYVLDLVVVLLSIVEVAVSGSNVVTVFRALRLLRVLKLLRNFPSLQSLVQVILDALQDTLYLTVVMLLVMFIFALAGMQFFGGVLRAEVEARHPDVQARAHFDTFLNAFYTVFQVISVDGWIDITWMAMDATNPAAAVYFIVLVTVGFYIVLNLFLSILIQGFEHEGDVGEADDDETDKEHRAAIMELQQRVVVRVGSKQYGQEVQINLTEEAQDGAEVNMMITSVAYNPLIHQPVISARRPTVSVRSSSRQGSPDTNPLAVVPEPGNDSADDDPEEEAATHVSAWTPSTTPRHDAAPVASSTSANPGTQSGPSTPRRAQRRRSDAAVDEAIRSGVLLNSPDESMHATDVDLDGTMTRLAALGPRKSAVEESPALGQLSSKNAGSPTVSREVANLPSEAVPAGAFGVDGVPVSSLGTCSSCGAAIQRVLNAPPFEKRLTDQEWHDTHCWLAEQRVQKERDVADLLLEVHERIGDDALLTPATVEDFVRGARSKSLLRNVVVDDLVSWIAVRDELRQELLVVRLAIGEEQLGRAHIAYVHAGLHLKKQTNGSTALFLFGPDNKFRIALTRIIEHPAFDAIVLLLIVASSVVLVIDNPRSDIDPTTRENLRIADLAFSIAFATEIVMRILATGLFLHPGAYLRSGWHWLDVLSVAVSFASALSAAKAVRVMRFMRPLRTIKRYRGLRLVVTTILNSIRGIVHVVLLSSLNYLIFGILAVQLFAGKLYSCTDESIDERVRCVGDWSREVPAWNGSAYSLSNVTEPRRWERYSRNFDHIGTSVLTLFQVSSGDDWADIMYAAIDARSVDLAPQRDSNPWAGLFFIAFFIVGNFFLLNLFVGVVIVNFSRVKEKIDGLAFLTAEQREWVDAQRAMLNLRPAVLLLRPKDAFGWRKRLDAIVRSDEFEYFIGACIALNIMVIGLEHDGMSTSMETAIFWLNLSFVAIFAVEMILKILAHRTRFFLVGWNRFDFAIVVVSVAAVVITLSASGAPDELVVFRVLRFLRLLRIARLIKKARRVRVLVETLWYSLPSIGNIALLIVIVYVVFAVVGVQVFSNVETSTARSRFLDDQFFNFHTFLSTMQLLFVFTTNEKWSDAMHDTMVSEPYCSGAAGTCGSDAAPLYYLAFTVIASFVMTNLFLAIILDNFATTMQMDESQVTLSDLHRFAELWALYDPDSTFLMPTKKLGHLLANLQPPLGTTRADSRIQQLRRMAAYRILDRSGQVHFAEVMVPLARTCVEETQQHEDGGEDDGNHLMGYDLTTSTFPELLTLPTVFYGHRPSHVGHTLAATYVAASYRRHLAQRRVKKMRAERRESINAFVSKRNSQAAPAVDGVAEEAVACGANDDDALELRSCSPKKGAARPSVSAVDKDSRDVPVA